MGIGLHCRIEVSQSKESDAFSDPEFLRSMVGGDIFVWRVPSIFHAIGLGHYESLPDPLIPLRGFPDSLSRSVVEAQCVLISQRLKEDVNRDAGFGFEMNVIDEATAAEWLAESGDSGVCEIRDPGRYFSKIQKNERLILDPGCQFPGWLSREEIVQAGVHCGVEISTEHEDSAVAHFATILDWMKSLELVYGKPAVRMVFWFDSVL